MDEMILEELENLIQRGEEIEKLVKTRKTRKCYQKIEEWEGSSLNLLKVRFGYNSDYFKKFKHHIEKKDYYDSEILTLQRSLGVLQCTHNALKKGLTDDLFYKQEIIIFSNILEQAFEFLDKKFKSAAGIYGRIILETTIKELAKKNNIFENRFDQIIIKLRQNNIIQKPLESSLRANYEIGSWAAHGDEKFQNLSDKEIKEFLVFIRDKVLTL